MATYREIQDEVRRAAGFVPKTCWIADLKSKHGLTTRIAPNRASSSLRAYPCPSDKRAPIEKAMRKFGMIK